MTILMVLDHNFPPDHRVEKEIQTLTSQNHKVILACYSYNEEKSKYEEEDNLKIYRKKISTFTYKSSISILKLPFYFFFWKNFLNEIVTKHSIDAIHIHDLPLTKIGVYIKNKYKIPLIVDLHENWPASLEIATHTNTFLGKILSSNKQWRAYEKEILQKADVIITVVEEMKNRISNLGISRDKIYIVSNTINLENFHLYNEEKDPEKITLFYAGGINIHRGLQIIIRALPLILKKKSNVTLNIVGKGSYKPTLEKLVLDLNLTNHVNFLGWKNLSEISKYLAKADITLIPHLKSEQTDCSSPNKLYQYIYARKPVLTSNCKSLERIVNETKSGLVYKHDSPEDFKNVFLKMINNKNLIDLNYGYKLIKEKYNWSKDSETLIKIYDNL